MCDNHTHQSPVTDEELESPPVIPPAPIAVLYLKPGCEIQGHDHLHIKQFVPIGESYFAVTTEGETIRIGHRDTLMLNELDPSEYYKLPRHWQEAMGLTTGEEKPTVPQLADDFRRRIDSFYDGKARMDVVDVINFIDAIEQVCEAPTAHFPTPEERAEIWKMHEESHRVRQADIAAKSRIVNTLELNAQRLWGEESELEAALNVMQLALTEAKAVIALLQEQSQESESDEEEA